MIDLLNSLLTVVFGLYKRFHNVILYGIIGGFSASLDFCTYTFLVKAVGLDYYLSNCISVIIGIITSFTLNRIYNFKVVDKVVRRFLVFLQLAYVECC